MIKMRKWKKVLCLFIICTGIAIGIYSLINKIIEPKKEKKYLTLYEYTFKPEVNYRVHLIDNVLFDNNIRGEGESYFKSILDYIEINFNTLYQATKSEQLDIEYTLIASVIGFSSSDNNRTDYWKKDFPLSEKKHELFNSDTIKKEESLKINLQQYEEIASKINELIEYNIGSELVISMTGRIIANTPDGNLETPYDIKLKIPLDNNILTLSKEGNEVITDQLSQEVEYESPLNMYEIIIISFGIAIGIISFIIMLLIIKEPLAEDILLLKVKKIINNYGSRMVAIKYMPDKTFTHIYIVNNIKDLLVISDEIHIPVYYITDEVEIVKDYTFYCEYTSNLYIYKEEDNSNDNNISKIENINQSKMELQEE